MSAANMQVMFHEMESGNAKVQLPHPRDNIGDRTGYTEVIRLIYPGRERVRRGALIRSQQIPAPLLCHRTNVMSKGPNPGEVVTLHGIALAVSRRIVPFDGTWKERTAGRRSKQGPRLCSDLHISTAGSWLTVYKPRWLALSR